MNTRHHNPGIGMRRHRQQVLALAVLWLVSSMMLALEPCCDVVAASLPHQHATTAAHSHPSAATAPHTMAHDHDGGEHDDEHCPTLDAPSGDAPYLPISGDTKSATDSPHGAPPLVSHTHAITAVAIGAYSNRTGQYALSGRTLFLRTERLRI